MKKSREFRKWLGIVLVMALILLIPFLFASCATKPTPVATATAVPSQPPTQASTEISIITPTTAQPMTATPVIANGQEPPPCTFPLAQIMTVESAPQNYTFSEPTVALTAPKGNHYHIIQWIPDNQQVLIAEDLDGSYVYQNDTIPQQSISPYNAVTGASKVYAIRPYSNEPPSWQPALNVVVYRASSYSSIDKAHNAWKFTDQLWASHGDPNAAQKLADNLSQFPLVVKPDGSEMIYGLHDQITGLDKSLKAIPSVSFDPPQWDYAKERRNSRPVSFQMAWQPGTSLIFLYSDGSSEGGGYTFILNADNGKVCELNLGGWAEFAHWSPNGRYLAFVRSTMYTFPFYTADLTVLDTVTGKLQVLSVIPQQIEGKHYSEDFAWAPDNRHLLAVGAIDTSPSTSEQFGLYLVDSAWDQSNNVMQSYKLYTALSQSIIWSPDGSKVAILCPVGAVSQICVISVHVNGQ